MNPTAENELYDQMMNTCSGLANHHCLSAYPHLSPLFLELSGNLQIMVTNALARQRQEAFYGATPWAKLYKLQTGKQIRLPEGIVKNLCGDRWVAYSPIPIKAIAKYAVDQGIVVPKLLRFKDEDGTEVTISLNDYSMAVSWPDNDMYLTLNDMGSVRASVECPLFDEPYLVDLEATFIHKYIVSPLYNLLTYEVDARYIEADPKYLLLHHFFGTIEEPIAVQDSHPFKQLAVLFGGSMYSNKCRSWADVKFKGRTIRFSGDRDYGLDAPYPNNVVKIASVSILPEGSANPITVSDWHKNPLFVRDLMNNMGNLFDQMITEHELSMKDDPSAV